MSQGEPSLEDLRKELNVVTEQIVALLKRRLELCRGVGRVKRSTNSPTVDLNREEELVYKLVGGRDSEDNRVLVRLLREIISACRSVQSEVIVAVPSTMRSHSMEAARSVFGSSCSFSLAASVEDCFRSVDIGSADFCVAPYEDTARGGYPSTLDALIDSDLSIVGEVMLPVEYHLVSSENSLSKIRVVVADVEALWACQRFLSTNLPLAKMVGATSRPPTVRRGYAYLVGKREAEDLGLNVVARNVEDERDNATRFIVVGKQGRFTLSSSGALRFKTTIVFTAPNRPGVLSDILSDFGSRGINLTMIGSRPLRKRKWEYAFIVDLDATKEDKAFLDALKQIRPKTTLLKVLGSYPTLTPDRLRIDIGK